MNEKKEYPLTMPVIDHDQTYELRVSAKWHTPESAAYDLQRQRPNRARKQSAIARYVTDMAADNWWLGAPLLYDDTVSDETPHGRLIDGANRLRAVIKADKAAQFLCISGFPPDTQDRIDIGIVRSAADQLEIAGVPNARRLAALVVLLVAAAKDPSQFPQASGRHSVTAAQIKSRQDGDDLAHAVVSETAGALKHAGTLCGSAAMLSYLVYVLRRYCVDPGKAESFLAELSGDQTGRAQSPVATWWKAMLKADAARGNQRITPSNRFKLLIHAWNNYFRGREVKKLYLRTDATPRIMGLKDAEKEPV